jgi:hypothetical protein
MYEHMDDSQSTGDGEASASLDRFYGPLHNYVRMVTGGYSNLLMLDAKGGLGKTHNVTATLSDELRDDDWYHQKGFTTPIELYKILWQARESGTVLFLDDMSGVTNNSKAIDMLKSATDTQGDENWVEYRTSQDIDHPRIDGATLPNTFCFRGRVIMSFNDTPDNRHFDALKDRGTYYQLSFDYQERLDLIDEIAKLEDFSSLSVQVQRELANWVRTVTDSSFEVTIRTFEEVCKMRKFSDENSQANWERMALEIFNLDYKKHRIIEMREADAIPVESQVEQWCDEFDKSESTYYDLLSEIRDEREN